jgi:plasmid stability protein
MATLSIRNLPDEVHRALRLRAARHGRSMEAEAREILAEVARARPSGEDAAEALRRVGREVFGPAREGALDEFLRWRREEAWRE